MSGAEKATAATTTSPEKSISLTEGLSPVGAERYALAPDSSFPSPQAQGEAVHLTLMGHDANVGAADAQDVSAAPDAYGLADPAASDERSGLPSGTLPLLICVLLLAAATIWFVARPVLDRPPRAQRTCEVFVVKSGTKCVPTPSLASTPVPQKTKSARPAKR